MTTLFNKFGLILAAVFLMGFSQGYAAPLIYNFATTPFNTLRGTSENFTQGGITITAFGFSGATIGTAIDLYSKNTGTDEIGLGLKGSRDHEINQNNYIELSLANLFAINPASLSLAFGSVQTGEGWAVYGSNQLGHRGKLLFTGTTDFPAFYTLTAAQLKEAEGFSFLSIQAPHGDILLSSLEANTVNVPEPATMVILGTGLALAAVAKRRRNA